MRVELLDKEYFQNDSWLKKIYNSYRRCYSGSDEFNEVSKDDMISFIDKHSNHESPLEHVNITVHIQGVSRSLTHQLVRHRLASYSQMSQRYVKKNFEYIIPPSIKKNKTALDLYVKEMKNLNDLYLKFVNAGIPNEDARYIFPNGAETKIVMSMNIRMWKHFFAERCCYKAQWEIRTLANEILTLFKDNIDIVFANVGPKCIKLGKCPENKSCGFIDKYLK